MISLDGLSQYYFDYFSIKDIENLSNLFSDDIELEDWNVKVKGKDAVIKAYQDIFNNVSAIQAYRVKFHECGSTMCCEIIIKIYGDHKYNSLLEEIQVMDVITFNNLMKIEKIKAYKI